MYEIPYQKKKKNTSQQGDDVRYVFDHTGCQNQLNKSPSQEF